MSKIPTAEEFARYYKIDKEGNHQNQDKSSYDMMIEFAKMHVKAALEKAANDVKQISKWGNNDYDSENPVGFTYEVIDKDSILNAYPDTLIQ